MKFSGLKAAHAFIGSKASRVIGEFLDPWPKDKLLSLIRKRKFITDLIPAVSRFDLKAKVKPYGDMLASFTNEEVYLWIPQKHRAFLERTPGGKEWALAELQHIREFLTS